jgi:hypothetical protein
MPGVLGAPEPTRSRKPGPANLEFQIIYDEDQGKLAGLPSYGLPRERI